MGPGQLGPGAQLSGAQQSTFSRLTIGPRTVGPWGRNPTTDIYPPIVGRIYPFSHHQQGRIDFNTVNPSLPTGKDFLIPVERLMMRECPYSTKMREVLGNPSLKPEGNLEGGVDQKIFPCGQGRIDSVKINPSLLMMREFTFPCPDPALEASIRWCYTVAMCYSRVTRCYILRTTQNRQQNLLGI